ncbi:hypothetical protein BDZ89DRAFT_1075994 [Hymenopellis radicata]|nr:hypothetical protein BDZ89DRAFT_1075994 [Hymenopellis radicata]
MSVSQSGMLQASSSPPGSRIPHSNIRGVDGMLKKDPYAVVILTGGNGGPTGRCLDFGVFGMTIMAATASTH